MAIKKKTTKQVRDQSVEAESSFFDEGSNFDRGDIEEEMKSLQIVVSLNEICEMRWLYLIFVNFTLGCILYICMY